MKRLCTLLLLVLPLGLHAQTTPPTSRHEEECTRLYQALLDNPDDVATILSLTHFYREQTNPMRNLGLAIKYVRQAEARYIYIVGSRQHYKEVNALLKRHITIDSIRTLKRQVEQQAVSFVQHTPAISQSELTALSGAFRGSPDVVRVIEQRRLSESYATIQEEHTILSYKQFSERYRGSDQAIEAQRIMVHMADSILSSATSEEEIDHLLADFGEYELIVRLAVKRKATLAYIAAAEAHTEESYRAFLSRYPSADEYSLAIEQLEHLLSTQYAALRTPRQLADFAKQHPDSPLAEEAMQQLRHMVGTLQDQSAARIYFAEFQLDAEYGNLYRSYYMRHLLEGNADPIVRFQEENPAFPYMAAVPEDLRQARARDSINLMRPYSEAVFLDFARDVRRLNGKGLAFVALQRTLQTHLANRDWPACNERLDYFCLSFDESCTEEYNTLRALINAPVNKQLSVRSELAPAYNIRSATLHPNQKHLYYTMEQANGMRTINIAQLQGKVWRNMGPVRFDNLENRGLTFYNFYDNARRMLIGQGGDILIAEFQDSLWHVVEIPPYPVNTDYEDYDAFMLPDGSGLLLASDRPGGHNYQHSRAYFHGDTALASDLYFIPRNLHGWGDPVNLGLQVNTPYCDHSPLLSSDLKTLYFLSDGHASFGYGDLFYCTRKNVDDWTSWSPAQNYGKEVNSAFAESHINFAPNEQSIYLCSNRNGRHSLFSLPTRHTPATRHVDVLLSAPNETLVDIIDLGTQCVITQISLPANNVAVRLSLNQDKTYAVQPHKQSMRFVVAESFRPKKGLHIELREYNPSHAPAGPQPMPLVRFEGHSAVLSLYGQHELDNMAEFLISHEQVDKIYLFVNVPGDDDQACFDLSRSRAVAIKRHLERLGVASQRIIITSYGNVNYPTPTTPMPEVEFLW